MDEVRFEQVEAASGGAKIRSRGQSAIGIDLNKASPADFLSRLWALFGPPNSVGSEGFEYHLRDRSTALLFDAYSGPSGPAYAGLRGDAAALTPVLDALDALLDATAPVDCAIEYDTDAGRYRIGSRDGRPFEAPLEIGPEEFDKRMLAAAEILRQQNRDAWDYVNALLELVSGWDNASREVKQQSVKDYQALASNLWVKAFEAIEETISSKFNAGKRDQSSTTETLLEVALVQLEEAAESSGIAWNAFEERSRAILALGRAGADPPVEQ